MDLVAIGDVGVLDGMIHIGDEAMFEEFTHRARERGVARITGISSKPGETASRYGIDAVSGIGFRGLTETESDERLALVTAAASGGWIPADDPAVAVIEAIAASDGVVVTGGGNMASVWPSHIYERLAVGRIAAAFAVPLVITGQTLGPELAPRHAALLAELLLSARLVGVRESASLTLAGELGVPVDRLRLGVDDATFLGIEQATSPTDPYCLVSLSTHVGNADRESFVGAVAALLDHVAGTGLPVRFLAHWASLDPGETRGDSLIHDRVRELMASDSAVVPTTHSIAAADLARRATLVVTSRYHPAVFATSAGTPTVAIPVDDYTGVKLRGVLANAGQEGVLPVAELLAGGGVDLLQRLPPRSAGLDVAASALWWDRVLAALVGP